VFRLLPQLFCFEARQVCCACCCSAVHALPKQTGAELRVWTGAHGLPRCGRSRHLETGGRSIRGPAELGGCKMQRQMVRRMRFGLHSTSISCSTTQRPASVTRRRGDRAEDRQAPDAGGGGAPPVKDEAPGVASGACSRSMKGRRSSCLPTRHQAFPRARAAPAAPHEPLHLLSTPQGCSLQVTAARGSGRASQQSRGRFCRGRT
jgi:hypothetical protein